MGFQTGDVVISTLYLPTARESFFYLNVPVPRSCLREGQAGLS